MKWLTSSSIWSVPPINLRNQAWWWNGNDLFLRLWIFFHIREWPNPTNSWIYHNHRIVRTSHYSNTFTFRNNWFTWPPTLFTYTFLMRKRSPSISLAWYLWRYSLCLSHSIATNNILCHVFHCLIDRNSLIGSISSPTWNESQILFALICNINVQTARFLAKSK